MFSISCTGENANATMGEKERLTSASMGENANASMGEKECLTSSASASMGKNANASMGEKECLTSSTSASIGKNSNTSMGEKECPTTSANASMGEKEHLIFSTNLLTRLSVYYTGYPVYCTGDPVKYHRSLCMGNTFKNMTNHGMMHHPSLAYTCIGAT